MAYDFPTSPAVGAISNGYTWDGEKWTLQTSAAPPSPDGDKGDIIVSLSGAQWTVDPVTGGSGNFVRADGPTLNGPVQVQPAASIVPLRVRRKGAGNAAGEYWAFGINDIGDSDGLLLGQSSSAYLSGGAAPWIGNNKSFLYFPSEFRIGTGVGAVALLTMLAAGISIGGDLTISGNIAAANFTPNTGRQLIATLTAANSASLDYTGGFTGYKDIELIFEALVVSVTNNGIYLLVHSGGGFQGTIYQSSGIIENPAGINAHPNVTSSIPITRTSGPDVQNFQGINGNMRCFNPNGTNHYKHWHGRVTYPGSTANVPPTFISHGAWNGGTGVITGFRVLPLAGNIVSGAIRVYGYPT